MIELWNNLSKWMENTPKLGIIPIGYFLVLLAVIIITVFVRWILVNIIIKSLEKRSKKTETELDDLIIDALKRPIGWIIIAIGLFIGYMVFSGMIEPDPDALSKELTQKVTEQVNEQVDKQIDEQARILKWSAEEKEKQLQLSKDPEKLQPLIKEALDKAVNKRIEDFSSFHKFMQNIFFSLIIIFVAWLLWKLVNNLSKYFAKKAEKTESKLDDQLVPIVKKLLKIVIAGITVSVVVQNFGFDVAGILAGFGLFGFAFAIAAQDTLGNMFGSATLFGSKSFQIGDYIKVKDIEGIVEEIGVRTTKIRQFDRHLVIIPNSDLSKGIITNISSRGTLFRLREKVGIAYDTAPEQIDEFVIAIREHISKIEFAKPETMVVFFTTYADFYLEILMQFFFDVPTFADYLREKHKFLIEVKKLASKIGIEFAFPSRTNYNFDLDYNKTTENNQKKFKQYMKQRQEQLRLEELKKLKEDEKTPEQRQEEMRQKLKEKEEEILSMKDKIRREEEFTYDLKKELGLITDDMTEDEKRVAEGLAKSGEVEED